MIRSPCVQKRSAVRARQRRPESEGEHSPELTHQAGFVHTHRCGAGGRMPAQPAPRQVSVSFLESYRAPSAKTPSIEVNTTHSNFFFYTKQNVHLVQFCAGWDARHAWGITPPQFCWMAFPISCHSDGEGVLAPARVRLRGQLHACHAVAGKWMGYGATLSPSISACDVASQMWQALAQILGSLRAPWEVAEECLCLALTGRAPLRQNAQE